MTGGLLEEQDMDDVYAMFQVNLVARRAPHRRVLPGMLARGRGLIVNNASISGYAYFPAASTYAASKAGVVALSESLRRELDGAGVEVMHLVTPGVRHRHARRDRGGLRPPHGHRRAGTRSSPRSGRPRWSRRSKATHIVGPGGRLAFAKLASRGPAFLLDAISAGCSAGSRVR